MLTTTYSTTEDDTASAVQTDPSPRKFSLSHIERARDQIADSIPTTGCVRSVGIGGDVHFKLECRSATGAFKERGAAAKLASLSPDEKERGVVAASAGNHAQGVAKQATKMGIDSLIVMPIGTPKTKIAATKKFGAAVEITGRNFDEAYEVARDIADTDGRVFIHPFDDPAIIAGQGTIGLEVAEQVPEVDVLVCAVGGGGLISGIATAVKGMLDDVEVVGVEPEVLPSMTEAMREEETIEVPAGTTMADGIAVRTVGSLPRRICNESVDRMVTVTEDQIGDAIHHMAAREKLLAEGAGAAPVAALLSGLIPGLADKTVVAVVSGGNIDLPLLAELAEQRANKRS